MNTARSLISAFAVFVLAAPTALAGATVAQQTKVGLGGAAGQLVGLFGGKTAGDGVESISVVKGDRRNLIVGDAGELVDLGEKKVYRIDYARKTYTVTTFDELRRQFEEAQQGAAEARADAEREAPEEAGREYAVDVDVKKTGKKQVINGFDTQQVIVTITMHEKGKTLEQAGGSVLTSDYWMARRLAPVKELQSFERRYASALFGREVSGQEFQAAAQFLSSMPELAGAMKELGEKTEALDGTPVRATLTFESVATAEEQDEGDQAEAADPSQAAAKMIGGFLFGKRAQGEPDASEPGSAERSQLFTSTITVTRADAKVEASKLAVPPDFRKVQ